MIGFQCAYLATYFPSIYWNCACLRIDAGIEEDAGTNYGKIAKAIGNMQNHGIKVMPIDINKSGYAFEPDEENNAILYGFKALNGVNGDSISEIINNRPFSSFDDFQEKTNLNRTVVLSLIKGGAFDCFEDRVQLMEHYLRKISEPKKRITLQNFKGLIDNNLVPQELDFQRRLFVFNAALKKYKKSGEYYCINNNFYDFYEQFFDVDELESYEETLAIPVKKWQKMYTKAMEPAKIYFKEHQEDILAAYNDVLFQEQWNKYANGTISDWEMDALGYYYHEHPLAHVRQKAYSIVPFKDLTEEPEVEYNFKRNGREIPVYKTHRIIGTVVGKNTTKAQVDILTIDSGVVTVKFSLDYFAAYNRRISDMVDGVSKVVESGWFNKGDKIVVNGFRRNDSFRAKSYRKTPSHQLYHIDKVNADGTISLRHARYGEEED